MASLGAVLALADARWRTAGRDGVILLALLAPLAGFVSLRLIWHYRAWAISAHDLEGVLTALVVLATACSCGFVVGMMLVEDRDSGVLNALAVTPVPAWQLAVIGTGAGGLAAAAQVLIGAVILGGRFLPWWLWGGLAFGTGLMAVTLGVVMAAAARDRVEAVALFKVLNVMTIMPLADFFLDEGALGVLWLLVPSGWLLEAIAAMEAGTPVRAAVWCCAGCFYALLLVPLVLTRFRAEPQP